MASRNWGDPFRFLDRGMRGLAGRVTFGATSIASQKCLGFTVERADVGTYTVTTDDAFPKTEISAAGVEESPFFGIIPTLIAGAGTDGNLAVTTDYNTATKVMTVKWMVAGSAADPANGAIIALILLFRNTSAPRKGA